MFLLRSVLNDKEGKLLVDNWYILDSFSEVVDKAYKIDAEKYQVFEAEDITNEVFLKLEEKIAIKDKEARKELYKQLKMEFEGKKIT